MKCVKCGRKATITSATMAACDSCFCQVIEGRVKKEIRETGMLSAASLAVLDDGGPEAKALIQILGASSHRKEYAILRQGYGIGEDLRSGHDAVALPWSADMEGEYFLRCVFSGTEAGFAGTFSIGKTAYYKPLLHVLSGEAMIYARIKKLSFEKRKASVLGDALAKLESEYPEVKFSIVKTIEKLKKDL